MSSHTMRRRGVDCATAFLGLLVALLICMCCCDDETPPHRYLLYGVNVGEGFNLRRDVYMRIANTVRQLRERGHDYVLVLPPWAGLPHWRSRQAHRWSEFFDLTSMNRFVPLIEYADFVKQHGGSIDSVLYLQHYSEGWNGEYKIKFDIRPCDDGQHYYKQVKHKKGDVEWRSQLWTLEKARFARLRCLSIQGESGTLARVVEKLESDSETLMIDRVETILHDMFGDQFYWSARRSMRYTPSLVAIANHYRNEVLGSDDSRDRTQLAERWEDQRPASGDALGGPYLCVHWRRRDFVRAHAAHVPSLNGTHDQIVEQLDRLSLNIVFISTDAEETEFRSLSEKLAASGVQVARFKNTTLGEGAVSIVDQLICAHARHFIGTHVSTFSYRIGEDREILGFAPATTFNRLCGDDEKGVECEQPGHWKIVYE